MGYIVYDQKSGKSKARITSVVFEAWLDAYRFSPKVVDGEVRHVLEDEPFAAGHAGTITAIVHTGDFIVRV